ncbi:hypothetical protein TNCV_3071791 [Trichonephila clavipes]|nr:hypothetical protein TNCV_3071791 [Trichonephila clavipes]
MRGGEKKQRKRKGEKEREKKKQRKRKREKEGERKRKGEAEKKKREKRKCDRRVGPFLISSAPKALQIITPPSTSLFSKRAFLQFLPYQFWFRRDFSFLFLCSLDILSIFLPTMSRTGNRQPSEKDSVASLTTLHRFVN